MNRFVIGSRTFSRISRKARILLGLDSNSSSTLAGRAGRAGVLSSAVFLLIVAALMGWLSNLLELPSLSLAILGIVLVIVSLNKKLARSRANLLALLGHMCALFAFYFFFTRMVNVTYVTDSIVGTYMGVVKVTQLQNPYSFSIKSLLDQLGFPPSFYTPRVDGTFEFHLNYPAMNFLSLLPSYVAGLHDLRDGVFVYYLASILIVFAAVPSRLKALSLAPFVFGFPLAVGYSWTDSIWAFFTLLTALLWRRNKGFSMLSFGLAAATKQIALVAAPFLLVRLWNETEGSRTRTLLKGSGMVAAGFLVPNAPFILASPTSWWSATVGPYLPSKTPLIPSGIGLSEILPDLGVALSSNFYTILTGLMTAICITAFVSHYKMLNRFLWAMPAVILFFYPRSLPNYIVYWIIPYLFEWFTYGNPSLSIPGLRSLSPVSLMVSGQRLLVVLKRRAGPAILMILTLTTVLMGASGAYVTQTSRPGLDVKVTGMMDPDGLGVATNLVIRVTNYGSQPVSPGFFVKWFFLWDLWNANRTDALLPNYSASYALTATDALAGVPRGSSFRLIVYDSVSGDFLGQSQSYTSNVARPIVSNPRFTWWTLDLSTGRQLPFTWKLSLVNLDPPEARVHPVDTNVSRGVELGLNSTINRESPGEIVLSQRLLFNETSLSALIYIPTPTTPPNGPALGAEATDGIHFLYYVFSPDSLERKVFNFGTNTTVVQPVVLSTWEVVNLDIQQVWLSQGWNSPFSLDVSLFLRSSQPGLFQASIQQVTSQVTSLG